MTPAQLVYAATPLGVAVLVSFLVYRLRLFANGGVPGRYLFLTGGLLAFLAAGWQWIRLAPEYADWFIPAAYRAIDIVQFVLAGIGALLAVIGLAFYADEDRHVE